MSDFTVVSSVPRAMLAAAIKEVARGELARAFIDLQDAAHKFGGGIEWTAGQRRAPDPIGVAELLETLRAECDRYRERYAVVSAMCEEASDLETPDDEGVEP